jgi:hypothetical protein
MATGTGKVKASKNHEASVSKRGTELTIENIESDTLNIWSDSPQETSDLLPVKQGPG